MKILFSFFTREDIGVAMVTNMISQLLSLFAIGDHFNCTILLFRKMLYVGISSVIKINRTLRERYFQHEKIKFVSPSGHVISSIYTYISFLFLIFGYGT